MNYSYNIHYTRHFHIKCYIVEAVRAYEFYVENFVDSSCGVKVSLVLFASFIYIVQFAVMIVLASLERLFITSVSKV